MASKLELQFHFRKKLHKETLAIFSFNKWWWHIHYFNNCWCYI